IRLGPRRRFPPRRSSRPVRRSAWTGTKPEPLWAFSFIGPVATWTEPPRRQLRSPVMIGPTARTTRTAETRGSAARRIRVSIGRAPSAPATECTRSSACRTRALSLGNRGELAGHDELRALHEKFERVVRLPLHAGLDGFERVVRNADTAGDHVVAAQ